MFALGRYRGRQELYQHQAPQVLGTLRRIAIVESTEASNRIEGIIVAPHRLKVLMAQAVPEIRSESEVAGYRDVLARIHELARRSPGLHMTGIDLLDEMLAQGQDNARRAGVAELWLTVEGTDGVAGS